MIGSRLYIKIYLTVIGSLALVVATLSLLAVMGRLDTGGPFEDRKDRFASAMLSPDLGVGERQRMLDRLSRALDADIGIYSPTGVLLQGAGNVAALQSEELTRNTPSGRHALTTVLIDGSRVVASIRRPFTPPRRNLIIAFLVIAAVVGVAAYPVVRHLTRRLDLLRQSMELWGKGTLSIRAIETGRDEIATVARTFNKAADRVEALVQSQKSLLANASHELRSPLARLRMATEIFELNQNANTKNEIIRNLGELDDLVEEILLKSRLGSDQPLVMDQLVDLLPLAIEEAALTGADVEGDAPVITGNEKLLRRLMRNLLQNAARHGQPPVTISLSQSGDKVAISVRDCGKGLAPEDMSRVFEPFFRPAGRAESDGGWGLGLALVAEIARLHGGRAYAAQTEGAGACFVVEIAISASGGGA